MNVSRDQHGMSPLRRRRKISLLSTKSCLSNSGFARATLALSVVVALGHWRFSELQRNPIFSAILSDDFAAGAGTVVPPVTIHNAKPTHRHYTMNQTGGRRRSKVHVCFSTVHGDLGTKLLLEEFGYEGVNAAIGDDWDLIYGGYPHCGKNTTDVLGKHYPKHKRQTKNMDWKMEHGLNKIMLQKGFDNLQPHQVYFPCMGCSASYCNKRDLCRILADINPDWCYVLPDHVERLKPKMNGTHPWLLKRDAFDIHKHTGSGVGFISTPDELPSRSVQATEMQHLVQPWNEPFLGKGPWRRKSEMRIFVAMTSVYPLRAYVYSKPYVILAGKRYTNSKEAMVDKCMRDTHSSTAQCIVEDDDETFQRLAIEYTKSHCFRCFDYHFYAEQTGMTQNQSNQLLNDTFALIAQVLKAGHKTLENHVINTGIRNSGASCFSQMRVDVGITAAGKPFIFEFPEIHGMKVKSSGAKENLTRELFQMVGLDAPSMMPDQRADFELAHRGGWILLDTA